MKGGKTAKCPEGQTRDKTTKECRDKKKPGRQTRRASVSSVKSLPKPSSPVKRHMKFQIGVARMQNSNSSSFLKWYRSQLSDVVSISEGMTNLKVEYNKGENVLDVSYDTTSPEDKQWDSITHDTMADPDDDCNHPLKVNGVKFCVSGGVIGHQEELARFN